MFLYNRICFALVFLSILGVILTLELFKEKSVTALFGKNISLPCNYSEDSNLHAVYWYKHASIGAADDKELVARHYQGLTSPLPGFDRFEITKNYSLMIYNVSILDETTYSYVLLNHGTHKGKLDLRVIALGELIIETSGSCGVTAPGRCAIAEEPLELQVKIVCKLYDVRPPVNLTWTRSDGKLLPPEESLIYEKGGLYKMATYLLISKSHFDEEFICRAEGEAVSGTSSMAVTLDVGNGSLSRWMYGFFAIIGIVLLALFFLVVMSYTYGLPRVLRAGTTRFRKPGQVNGVESQPLNEQQDSSSSCSSNTCPELRLVIPFQAKEGTPSNVGHFFLNKSEVIQDGINICCIALEQRTPCYDKESVMDNQRLNNPDGMLQIWRSSCKEMALSNPLQRTIESFFQTLQYFKEALSFPADVQPIGPFVKEDTGEDADEDDLPGEGEIYHEKTRPNQTPITA